VISIRRGKVVAEKERSALGGNRCRVTGGGVAFGQNEAWSRG